MSDRKSNVLGIDVSTLQSISDRATEIITRFNEKLLSVGDTGKLGRINGVKALISDMEQIEAVLGKGIHTEQWDADVQKLRQIMEIQQEANRNSEWRNLESVQNYLASIQPQNVEEAATSAKRAADEAQREVSARQESARLAAQTSELVQSTSLAGGNTPTQNNGLVLDLTQLEEIIKRVNTSMLQLPEGFSSTVSEMGAGIKQLVSEMTKLNQTATDTATVLQGLQGQRIGLDAESLRALADAVTRSYQQAGQSARELEQTSEQVASSARNATGAVENETKRAATNIEQAGLEASRVVENLDRHLDVVSRRISGVTAEGQKMSALVDTNGNVISATRETQNDTDAIKRANALLAEQKQTILDIFKISRESYNNDNVADDQIKRLDTLIARFKEIQSELNAMPKDVLNQKDVAKRLEDNIYLASSKERAFWQEQDQKSFADTEKKVRELESALRDLIKAQNEYRTAVRNKDEDGQRQRQGEIDSAKQRIQLLQQDLGKRQLNEQQEKRVAKAISEATAQQNKHNAALTMMQKSGAELDRIFQRMTRWVVQMLVIRQLREAWRDAVSYAKEYYDALNEIRVVSGITAAEAQQ